MSDFETSEGLMILDGLYGVITEVIRKIPNDFLRNILSARILRELKLIIMDYSQNELKPLQFFHGFIINKTEVKEEG